MAKRAAKRLDCSTLAQSSFMRRSPNFNQFSMSFSARTSFYCAHFKRLALICKLLHFDCKHLEPCWLAFPALASLPLPPTQPARQVSSHKGFFFTVTYNDDITAVTSGQPGRVGEEEGGEREERDGYLHLQLLSCKIFCRYCR